MTRVEVVRTGLEDFDAWFKTVHAMQVAVNESERVKLQIVSTLGHALGLSETAELEACAAAIRSRAESLLRSNKRVAFQFDASAALNAPAPAAAVNFPLLQADAEAMITVNTAVENGPLPQSAEEMATAVRRAIRSSLALRKRMFSMVTYRPLILAAGRALEATIDARRPSNAAELRLEFRDAIEFLEGLRARATVEAQSAFRFAVRLQASSVVHPPEDEEGELARRRVLEDAALAIDAAAPDALLDASVMSDAWWTTDGQADAGLGIDSGRVDVWAPPDAGSEDAPIARVRRRR